MNDYFLKSGNYVCAVVSQVWKYLPNARIKSFDHLKKNVQGCEDISCILFLTIKQIWANCGEMLLQFMLNEEKQYTVSVCKY